MSTPDLKTPAAGIQHLGRSYAVGLSLIAALGIAAAGVISIHSARERTSALRTNLAGRQRMLTQRVITEAFRAAHARTADPAARVRERQDLDSAFARWAAGFIALRDGSGREGLPPMRPEDASHLKSMEPGRHQLASAVASMAYGSMAYGSDRLAQYAFADSTNAIGTLLIARLDHYVQALDARHRRSVLTTQRIAGGYVCLLLLLLSLEATFVFRPATRAIDQLMRDQEAVKHELYAKAEDMYRSSVLQEMQNDTLHTQQQTLLEQQEELMAQQTTLIQQRDHLEERARELTRLTGILDATPDAVAVFALTGDVLYSNAAAEQHMTHMRRRDWTHAAHLLTPNSVRQLRDIGFPSAIRHGVWQGEARLRQYDGPDRIVVQTLLAHRGTDGRVMSVTVMLQDITEQKSLQEKLAAGEARNRAIIEALAEGVVVQDGDGHIMQWNSSAERILGLTADQIVGRTSADAAWQMVDAHGAPMTDDMHPISRARVLRVSIDGQVMGVRRADNSSTWLSVNARPMPSSGRAGEASAVATFSDITGTITAARELEKLSVVARQSDHAILMLDKSGRTTWVNTAWEQLSGYTLAEIEGQYPGAVLHGTHTRPEAVANLRAAIVSGERWSGELLNYDKGGQPYWVELNVTPTRGHDDAITGYVALSRDITPRRNAERERQQLAAAVAVTADGIAITDVSGALEFANNAFARMNGYGPDELLTTTWMTLYEPAEATRLVRAAIAEVTKVGFWHGDATGRRKDGTLYPQELSLTSLPLGGLVAVARDISERKAAEAQLRQISVRDALTSLYNRRGFLEQADTMLRLSARQNVPCALLYGDLDAFKAVNDDFGHGAGDAALQAVAGILTSTFRDTDLIARLGGDEFTILAIDVKPSDVAMLMERVAVAVVESNASRASDPTQAWHLGISLGVAYFDPAAAEHVETLLRTADAALYEQKRHRRAALLATQVV